MGTKSISIIGCGWLGLPLGESLVKQGYQIHGSTTTESKLSILENAGIEPYLLQINDDLDNRKWPNTLLRSNTLCITIPPGRRRDNVQKWYPAMIQTLVDAALAERQIKKLIFTSSTGVYGQQTGEISEESPLQPTSPSANALIAAEKQIRNSGVPWIILRLAGLYGPGRDPGKWLAGKEALKNGNDPINLVHQQDVIQIIAQLLESNIENEIFNLCADEHPRKKDFYPKRSEALGLIPPTFLSDEKTSGKIVSNAKVKNRLDYTFTDLERF